MKVFYDTEFFEDGRTIDLISIGMIAEDGRDYYAVTAREDVLDLAYGHPWLSLHVVPLLPVTLNEAHFDWQWNVNHADWPCVKPPKLIAAEVRDFILAKPDPQLWAWYGAYDHVVLAQMFGPMINMPEGIPMWTNDLRQEVERLSAAEIADDLVPRRGDEHNALADARWNRDIHAALTALEPS